MREVSCRNEPSGAYTVLHAVPSINTHALYAEVTNSIARKGVERVEDPCVSPSIVSFTRMVFE